jgi:integrase
VPRSARNVKLETRSARGKLPKRRAPYFVKIAKGLRLGYYRGSEAGTWIGRRHLGGVDYATTNIGIADDTTEADGVKVLDFWQAQEVLRRWGEAGRLSDRGIVRKGPYTVRSAIEDYMSQISVEKSGTAVQGSRYVFEAHILPDLGHFEVEHLTTDLLTRWRNQLASRAKRVRKRRTAGQQATKVTPDTEEARRKRRATANRVTTMLKAALNRAYIAGLAPSDDAWRKLKPFKQVDAAVVRYLSRDEIQRLVNACKPDFRPIVQAALLTGCRYAELATLKCGDFNRDSSTLTIRLSKSGKPRHIVLTEEGQQLFEVLTAGRPDSDFVFRRADGHPWGTSHQQRPLDEAARGAKITPAPTFHILRHTHASLLAMKGVPMGVIAAQLGHSDTRMTEKHYAHLAPSYVAETIRAHFPRLGLADEPSRNVLVLKTGSKKQKL